MSPQREYKIFVSYSRSDTGLAAEHLIAQLKQHFGAKSILTSLDSNSYIVGRRADLFEAIDRSDLFLALIGPNWLGGFDEPRRQFDSFDEESFTSGELERALIVGSKIIPVLFDRKNLPVRRLISLRYSQALANIRPMLRLDRGPDFDRQAENIIRCISYVLERSDRQSMERYGNKINARRKIDRQRIIVDRTQIKTGKASTLDAFMIPATAAAAAADRFRQLLEERAEAPRHPSRIERAGAGAGRLFRHLKFNSRAIFYALADLIAFHPTSRPPDLLMPRNPEEDAELAWSNVVNAFNASVRKLGHNSNG